MEEDVLDEIIIFFFCNTGNNGLCGKPLSNPCNTVNKTPSNTEATPSPSPQEKRRKHHILITVVVVVVIVIALTLIVALVLIRNRRRKRSLQPILGQEVINSQKTTGFNEAQSLDLTGDFKKGEHGDLTFVGKNTGGFDLQDLLRASAEVLGSGSFGSTYKAMILNGPDVVVKRFRHMNNVGKQEFFEHMKRLGSLTHPNLLPLVAFYYKKEEKFLVYEYGENGSLASHLHGMSEFYFMVVTNIEITSSLCLASTN